MRARAGRRVVGGLGLVLVAAWSAFAVWEATFPTETVGVVAIVDGDTVVLENGDIVRYLGIDAPETVHPEKPVECYGREASDRNRDLVLGKSVVLEPDMEDRDHYGRLLRYVYVEGIFVNGLLVREGYAYAAVRPGSKHLRLITDLEHEAREHRRGLWALCHSTSHTMMPAELGEPTGT